MRGKILKIYTKNLCLLLLVIFMMVICFPKYTMASSKTAYNINLLATPEETVTLPNTTSVRNVDGTVSSESIKWDMNSTLSNLSIGEHVISGKTQNTQQSITATIRVKNHFNIAAVGDSVTYGLGISNNKLYAYPGQLNSRLGDAYTVTNYGYSGATLLSNGNKPYIKTAQYAYSLQSSPDAVIIQLGSNDSKTKNYEIIDQFTSNYKTLISQYQNLSTKPIIYIALPPEVFGSGGTISASRLVTIRAMISELALEYENISIIDNFSVTANTQGKVYFSDGLHPTEKGSAIIANNVYTHLKGMSEVPNGQSLSMAYDTSSGVVNGETNGVFNLQTINSQDWIKFKDINVDSMSNQIQLLSSVTGNNIYLEIRADSPTGSILANEKLIPSNNGFDSWLSQLISINRSNVKGTHDIYFIFNGNTVLKTAELARIRSVNFSYQTFKNSLIKNEDQLELALQANIKNITLGKDITLTRGLAVNSETVLNLNQYVLDTGKYYITKNEGVGKQIDFYIKNGYIKGNNNLGSIYTGNSNNTTNGFNISVHNVNFQGVLFIYNNAPNTWIRFSGNNRIESTVGSNVYARNIYFEKNSVYYGSTQGGGSSDASGSTVIALGGGNVTKQVIIDEGAKVELYPGSRGSGYGQNAISNFSSLNVKKNATFKARGEQPMLRTSYSLSLGAQVQVENDATFDVSSTNAVYGFSYSQKISYVFNGAKFINLESSAINRPFMYTTQLSNILIKNNNKVKVWSSGKENSVSPTLQWDNISYISWDAIYKNQMGTVFSLSSSFSNQFGDLNNYSKIQFSK